LGSYRGLARVTDWVERSFSDRNDAIEISDFDGDLKFVCRLDAHISRQIFWRGYYSAWQLAVLDRVLQDDMVFMDIGANEGEQTVFCAKRLPRGRVIAFEPSTVVYERLTRNVALNGFANVTLVKRGLGKSTDRVTLYSSAHRSADGSYNEGLATLYPREGVSEAREVIDIARLDDCVGDLGINRLDIVKIDVEGSELDVLKGAEQTLRTFRPSVVLEVITETSRAAGHEASALLDFLRSLGYRFDRIARKGRREPLSDRESNAALHCDVFCYYVSPS
jgi:FkbM family methyltransferase